MTETNPFLRYFLGNRPHPTLNLEVLPRPTFNLFEVEASLVKDSTVFYVDFGIHPRQVLRLNPFGSLVEFDLVLGPIHLSVQFLAGKFNTDETNT